MNISCSSIYALEIFIINIIIKNMAAESRVNNQVVLGRTVASLEQTPYTIEDQIHRMEA